MNIKKLLIVTAAVLIFASCKKSEENNYCYQCVAQGTTVFTMGQQRSSQECDLTKEERDEKADQFENDYPISDWNVSCSRTSE